MLQANFAVGDKVVFTKPGAFKDAIGHVVSMQSRFFRVRIESSEEQINVLGHNLRAAADSHASPAPTTPTVVEASPAKRPRATTQGKGRQSKHGRSWPASSNGSLPVASITPVAALSDPINTAATAAATAAAAAAKVKRKRRWDTPTLPSDRQRLNAAKELSLTEVPKREGEAPYRPFELYDDVLAGAGCLPSGDTVAATLMGLGREGPFLRNPDELSAERAVVLVSHASGTVGRIDTASALNGETWRLRVTNEDDADGEHESDIIHITRGFRVATPGAAPPGDALPSFLSKAAVARMGAAYQKVRRGLETDWHEQKWRGCTNDPNRHEHLSAEFGWSTMIGGSETQKKCKAEKKPYRLKAWKSPKGKAFYKKHIEPLLGNAWRLLAEQYPAAAANMLAAVPEEYRLLPHVGFTKVTVAIDNPTPLHFDDGNFGATFLVSFELGAAGSLVGGSHILCGTESEQAVVVGDCPDGVVFLGDYRRVLHSNAARRGGSRLVVTAYCANSLVKLVARRSGTVS